MFYFVIFLALQLTLLPYLGFLLQSISSRATVLRFFVTPLFHCICLSVHNLTNLYSMLKLQLHDYTSFCSQPLHVYSTFGKIICFFIGFDVSGDKMIRLARFLQYFFIHILHKHKYITVSYIKTLLATLIKVTENG